MALRLLHKVVSLPLLRFLFKNQTDRYFRFLKISSFTNIDFLSDKQIDVFFYIQHKLYTKESAHPLDRRSLNLCLQ